MIIAFITNKNSPKVRIVTGRVNKIKIGFTIKLSNAKTIATTMDVEKLSTETPVRKFESSVTKIAVTNNRISNDIIFEFFISILQQ